MQPPSRVPPADEGGAIPADLGPLLRRLEAFERISTAALETQDLQAFLHTLLRIFLSAADAAETGTILLRQGDELHVRASIGMPEDVESSFAVPIGAGFAGKIAATGRPLFLSKDEIAAMTTRSPGLRRLGLCELYGVPLVHEGEVIGVAHIGSTRAGGFSAAEKRLLAAMVERAAWAVSLQRVRERLYAVLHSAPALIAVWRGPDYVCEFANVAFRRRFGDREVVGRRHTELVAIPEIIALFDRVLQQGETVSLEEHATTADFNGVGTLEERFFNYSFHPLRNGFGEPDAVLSFAVDLTAQVLARRALEQSERHRAQLLELERAARREAEIAAHAKDEFLATVSHELRTPLNAILGWAASLRRGAVKDVDRGLGLIERNARAQARIVDDVLDLSRIVSGKLRLDVTETDIGAAVFGAIEAVRAAAEAKGVALDLDIAADLGPLMADAGRVQQIVWNLLSNGVKFTPRGGRVHLSATKEDGDVVVRVVDTGQGIAPEFLPHVFEPFRQADASTTRTHSGLGLGLAIVRQLVAAHGGTIVAESAGTGSGAAFTCRFPARAAASLLARQKREAPPSARKPEAVRLDNVRVLVVDDEHDSCLLVREVLASEGALVELAGSAEEALQRLADFRPDVLVTDIGMPRMDGYALLRTVRALPAEHGGSIPAIALTAYAGSEDRDRAEEAGFQVHLAKPVDPWDLVARVADLRPTGSS